MSRINLKFQDWRQTYINLYIKLNNIISKYDFLYKNVLCRWIVFNFILEMEKEKQSYSSYVFLTFDPITLPYF